MLRPCRTTFNPDATSSLCPLIQPQTPSRAAGSFTGPIIAATVRASIHDPEAFRTGRDLAAWIGITPRANSSGGKERLGKISKRRNKQLRTLLIVGATSILKQACRGSKLLAWLISLMARRPYKVAAVALANKMARTDGCFSSRVAPTYHQRPQRRFSTEFPAPGVGIKPQGAKA